MIVKELIKHLQTMDPDLEVILYDSDEDTTCFNIELVEEVETETESGELETSVQISAS